LPKDLESWLAGGVSVETNTETTGVIEENETDINANLTLPEEDIDAIVTNTTGDDDWVETENNTRRMLKHLNKTHFNKNLNLKLKDWNKGYKNFTENWMNMDNFMFSLGSLAKLDIELNKTGWDLSDFLAIYRIVSKKYKNKFENVTSNFFMEVEKQTNDYLKDFKKIFGGLKMDRKLILSVLPDGAKKLFDNILNFEDIRAKESEYEKLLSTLDVNLAKFFTGCFLYPDHFSPNYEFLSYCTRSGLKKLWMEGDFKKALKDLKQKPEWFIFENDKDMIKKIQ